METDVPLRRLFAFSSLAFLAVLAFSPVKNALRPYRAIQRQYRELGTKGAPSMSAGEVYASRPIAIQQIWLPDFENRVDRCTTCHLGVADTVMAGAEAAVGAGRPSGPDGRPLRCRSASSSSSRYRPDHTDAAHARHSWC